LIIQAGQGPPNGDPNVLHQIIDPVGVAFINGRDATHHGGVDFDYLFQLDHTAPYPGISNPY
jgi:hypothetical protein